jgi:glyoxalase-like protein
MGNEANGASLGFDVEISRRGLLRFSAMASVVGLTGALNMPSNFGFGGSSAAAVPIIEAADHLLFACADLDTGMAWVLEHAGVKPAIGGVHPGLGTRNALVSLGRRQYLEVIGIDPTQQARSETARKIEKMTTPQLLTWAAGTKNIEDVAKTARAADIPTVGPFAGSRTRPDGRTLNWKSLSVRNELGGVIPFFIEWGAESVHPSTDSPPGCSLFSFDLEHPEPERVRELLAKLGLAANATRGAAAKLRVILETPKGKLQLP